MPRTGQIQALFCLFLWAFLIVFSRLMWGFKIGLPVGIWGGSIIATLFLFAMDRITHKDYYNQPHSTLGGAS